MATALDTWINDFPYKLNIERDRNIDEYDTMSEILKIHNIRYMLLGSQLGFMTQEDLNLAKILR